MTTIHPHWEPMDESPRRESRAHVRIATQRNSRRPAAIIGIFAIILAAFFVLQNWDSLTAQVAPTPIIVRITKDGAIPRNFSAQPGQTITLKNSDTVTRVLSSDLPTASGSVRGIRILPGASESITIVSTALPGSYSYSDDNASDAILGKVTILQPAGATIASSSSSSISQAADVAASTGSVALAPAANVNVSASAATTAIAAVAATATEGESFTLPHNAASSAPSLSSTSSSSAASLSQSPAAATSPIERNPHVVGSVTVNGQQTSIPANGTITVNKNATAEKTVILRDNALHNGAPLAAYTYPTTIGTQRVAARTTSVPETGPAMWIVGALALGVFGWIVRRKVLGEA